MSENKSWLEEAIGSQIMTPEKAYELSQGIVKARKQAEGLPLFGNGIAGNVIGGAASAFLRGGGDTAGFFNFDNVDNALNSAADSIEEYLPPTKPAELSWNYITSPGGLARSTGNALGSIASIALPTVPFAGPLAKGARAITNLTRGKIGLDAAKMGTFGAASAIPEAAMEADNFEDNAVANGMNPEEARQKSWGVFGRNAPFLMASNAAQFGLLPKLVGKGTTLKSRLATGAGEIAAQGLEEGYQEGFQNEMAGKAYTYNPANWFDPKYTEQLQAVKEGIAGFALPTAFGLGVGEVRRKISNKKDDEQGTANLKNWGKEISGNPNADETIDLILANAKKLGYTPEQTKLALALATQESNMNQASRSQAGAIGVMQLMPETAKELGVTPYDKEENIYGGLKYLKQHLDRYNGDWKKAAAAYNAGAGVVDYYKGVPPFEETQNYVSRIEKLMSSSPEIGGENETETPTSILGVEDYQPETQGENITEQVKNLKSGWEKIIPQIGGALKNKFGVTPVISSAARTTEHNTEVGGSENSHHIIRENGGDALDIVFNEETTAEQQEKIAEYFKGTGLFKEVLYHDAGSGAHLHLGGLNVEKLNEGGKNIKTASENLNTAEEEYTPAVDEVVRELVGKSKTPHFDIEKPNKLNKAVYEDFVFSKQNDTADLEYDLNREFFGKHGEFFDKGGKFVANEKNRASVREHFGEDAIKDFGQKHLAERINAIGDMQKLQGLSNFKLNQSKNKEGETIFGVELQNRLSPNIDSEIESLAEEYGGTRAKKRKYFNFEDAESRNGFVTEAENYIESLKKAKDEKTASENLNTAEEEYTPAVDEVVRELVGKSKTPHFDIEKPNKLNKAVYEDFVFSKQNDTADLEYDLNREFFGKHGEFFDKGGKFVANEKNRASVREHFGKDAIKDFGQKHLAERINAIGDMQKLQGLSNFKLNQSKNKEGETIFGVELQNRLSPNIDSEIESLAEEYGGTRAKKRKYFNFEDAESRNGFVTEAENYIESLKKAKDETKTPKYAKQVEELLTQESGTKFNPYKGEPVTKNIISQFAQKKYENRNTTEGNKEFKQNFRGMFKDGKFFNTAENRAKVAETYKEELQNFGQNELNKQIAEYQNWRQKVSNVQPAENVSQVQAPVQTSTQVQTPAKKVQPEQKQAAKVETPKTIGGLQGNVATTSTDNDTKHDVRYKVVDAQNLITSHEITGNYSVKNEKYPQGLQPRDREGRTIMGAQVLLMANKLDPSKLMEGQNVNQGAPVVRNDGIVLNGNGRTMAITQAYKIGKADEYRKTIIDNAEKFGLNRAEIEKVKNPVLVREIVNPLDENSTAEIINSKVGGAEMSASEKAKIDAKKITRATLESYVGNQDANKIGDLTTAENSKFVSNAIENIVNRDELNAYVDKNANVSSDGLNRVKRAMFALAYEDGDLIAKMSESPDDNVRNLTNALVEVAPKIASLKMDMQEEKLPKYEIAKDISDATKKISELRNENKPVQKYLQEQNLFSEYKDTDSMRELLDYFDKNKNSKAKISQFLKEIISGIESQREDKNSIALDFGKDFEKQDIALNEIIKAARNRIENVEGNIFEGAKEKQNTPQVENTSAVQSPSVEANTKQETKAEMKVGELKASDAYKVQANMSASEQEKFNKVMSNSVKYNGKDMTRLELVERVASGEIPEKAMGSNKTAEKYLGFLKGNFPNRIAAIQKAGLNNVETPKDEGRVESNGKNSVSYIAKNENPALIENLSRLAKEFNGTVKTNSKGKPVFNFSKPEESYQFEGAANIFLNNGHLPYFKQAKVETSAQVQTPAKKVQPAQKQAEKVQTSAQVQTPAKKVQPAQKQAAKVQTSAQVQTPAAKVQPVQTPTPAPKSEKVSPVQSQTATKVETSAETKELAQAEKKRTRIFGTNEETARDLKKAFGIVDEEPKSQNENIEDDIIPADKFVNVIDDSDEALASYIAEWNAEIKKTSSTPMFNPKLWTAGIKIGLVYIQRGINNLANWKKQITETLGEESKDWQPAIWEMLKTRPKIDKFNDEQVTSIANRIGSLYEDGTTKFEEIYADFVKTIGEENTKKIEPMIRATYNGVEKFFETLETKKAANEGENNSADIELVEGYRTESGRSLNNADRNEFIIKPDGTKDFGRISEEIAEKANAGIQEKNLKGEVKAVPIRLQVGMPDTEDTEGFGYIHILPHINEIKSKGFDNIPKYVEHILENFNQVRKAGDSNRIILYCKGDESKGLMPMDLELEKDNVNEYYRIITAYPRRRANKKDTLILDMRPTNISTDAATAPNDPKNNNKGGVDSRSGYAEENVSSENITQADKNDNIATENKSILKGGEHTHTKTGEKIPSVEMTERVENGVYVELNKLAKKYGGSYSKFAKKFLFKTEEGRNKFLEEANRDILKIKSVKVPKMIEEQKNESKTNKTFTNREIAEKTVDSYKKAELETYDTIKATFDAYNNGKMSVKEALARARGAYDWYRDNVRILDAKRVQQFEGMIESFEQSLKEGGNKNDKAKSEIERRAVEALEYAAFDKSPKKFTSKINGNTVRVSGEKLDSDFYDEILGITNHDDIHLLSSENNVDATSEYISSAKYTFTDEKSAKIFAKALEIYRYGKNNVPKTEEERRVIEAIEAAGLEDVIPPKEYKLDHNVISPHFVIFEESLEKDAETLKNLTKLAETLGGERNKNKGAKVGYFGFKDLYNSRIFKDAAKKFLSTAIDESFTRKGNFAGWDKTINGSVLSKYEEQEKIEDEIAMKLAELKKKYEAGEISEKELMNRYIDAIQPLSKVAPEDYKKWMDYIDNVIEKAKKSEVSKTEKDAVVFTEPTENDKAKSEIEPSAREALKAAGLEGEYLKNDSVTVYKGFIGVGRSTLEIDLEFKEPEENLEVDFRHFFEKALDNLCGVLGDKYTRSHNDKNMYNVKCNSRKDAEILNAALNIYLNGDKFSEKTAETKKAAVTVTGEESGEYGGKQNESSEFGKSGRADGGHKILQSEVREGTDEETRQEGRVEVSERVSGQERQTSAGTESGDIGTNAESARPNEENGAGESSARVSAGNGVRGSAGVVQSTAGNESGNASTVSEVETAGHNFRITDDTEIGNGGLKAKFKQNTDAIKLLKQIESEGRFATPSEQKILSQFNGWGTLADAFTNKEGWEKEYQQLQEILTPEEYDKAFGAITNAFYTPVGVAKTMWAALQKLGFKGGRILDPSMGSGIFFGTMPAEISKQSELVGVELDDLTGRIAKQLYQKAAIDITGFEKRPMPNNYFDVAISNVPFNSEIKITNDPDYRKDNYKLQDYFFAKAIDKVRPGGIVAFITNTGTMDSNDSAKIRAAISEKADLIAAYRLPNTTFDKNAGTKAISEGVFTSVLVRYENEKL